MPNIELHGFGGLVANSLKCDIGVFFKDKPYAGDMIVTIIKSQVENLIGKWQPYARLFTSEPEHAQEIISGLIGLGLEVEYIQLAGFFEPRRCRVCGGNLKKGSISLVCSHCDNTEPFEEEKPCPECGQLTLRCGAYSKCLQCNWSSAAP